MRLHKETIPIQGATILIFLIVGFVLLTCFSCSDSKEYNEAKVYKVTSRSELIGGEKALGNKGDYILENEKIRVLINGHPTDMSGGGVNKWGGAILDADIQRSEDFFEPGKSGKDALLEIIPIMDVKTFGFENIYGSGPIVKIPQDAIEIVNDGSDGGKAELKVSGVLRNLVTLLKVVPVPLNMLPVKAETTYTIEPGKNYMEITSTFKVLERDASEPENYYDIDLRPITKDDNALFSMFSGDAFGDAVFWGDSLDIIGPGVYGFSSSWYAQQLYDQGVSLFLETPLVDWSAGVNDDIGYALLAQDGPLSFPITEDFLTIAISKISGSENTFPQPGATFSYKRYLVVDEGDVGGLLDHVIDIKGWSSGNISGNVISEATGEGISGAKVLVFPHPRFKTDSNLVPVKETLEEMNEYLADLGSDNVDYVRLMPYSRFISDGMRLDTVADGSFEGNLPYDEDLGLGDYIVMASGPGNTHSKLVPVTILPGVKRDVSLLIEATGTLKIKVRSQSQEGPDTPAKISIIGVNGEGVGDPFISESYLPGKMAKVIFSENGYGEAKLKPGTYIVNAGRGPEYSEDQKTVTVSAMETTEVDLKISRVVDTSGWVAADLHMHTSVSPDSGLSVKDRVLTAMAEGLDLVTSTDHDFIRNYRPEHEAVGGRDRFVFFPGEELSHFSYAHFNSYPLVYNQEKTSGGAAQWRDPSPSTSLPDGTVMPLYTPQDCFDSMRDRGDSDMVDQDPIVIVNHSQQSITGYLRAFGFEQYYGTFGSADFFTVGDPVVHNGKLYNSDTTINFSWDFEGMELLNGKRLDDFRTFTEEELTSGEFGEPRPADSPLLPTMIRTGEEWLRIKSGELLLDHTNRGMIDDYMTLLAIGKRVAGVGTSDSHDAVKTPLGICRTYVMSSTDDPKFVDEDEFLTNLKAGRAIASSGPFMEMWVDGYPVGSDLYDPDGTVDVRLKVQAPEWMSFDRIEIYGNGELIGEIGKDSSDVFLGCHTEGLDINSKDKVVRFDETISCEIDRDTFILAVGVGYEGMFPHVPPIDGPSIEIEDTLLLGVNELLEQWIGIPNLIPVESTTERNHENYPYVITNATFVDTDGYDADGDGSSFDAPGPIPGWFDEEDIDNMTEDSEALQVGMYAAKSRMSSMYSQFRNLQGVTEALGDDDDDEGMGCGGWW